MLACLVGASLAADPSTLTDREIIQLAQGQEDEKQPEAKKMDPADIFRLPLEQLGNVPARVPVASGFQAPVTSVGRQLEFPVATTPQGASSATVGTSPAAVYVINEEDIRRSGMQTIPDLLRMVPGIQVARIDANKWAVSSRGFNGRFANKLLVQMDGRSLYTPLFAGVYWDERDTLLEDIERIEVIRGPGATLWGSNAVNGIISIITKSAEDTQGLLVTGLSGQEERGYGALRYGGQVGPEAYYRVYFKYWDWDNGFGVNGEEGFDGWDQFRGGFRFDWKPTPDDHFMLQGDMFNGDLGDKITLPFITAPLARTFDERIETEGGFILGRYSHVFNEESDLSIQLYYDRVRRSELTFTEARDILDLDFQHRFPLTKNQQLIYGFGYRYTTDRIDGTSFNRVIPDARGDHFVSTFIQDDFTVVKDRLHFIVGSKFEYNDYVGFLAQPSARLLWTPTERQTAWAAVSRAMRTPSRIAENLVGTLAATIPTSPLVTQPITFGNPAINAEDLIAYEVGYRASPSENFLIDVAAFYNDYNDLITTDVNVSFLAMTPPPPHVVLPNFFFNGQEGESYGLEIASTLKISDNWQLHAGYTWLQMQLHQDFFASPRAELAEGASPHNQFHIRSYANLPFNLEFDTALYYVDNLPSLNIPSYTRLDARIAWRPNDGLECVIGLQNLLDPRHPEFVQEFREVQTTEAERTIYGLVRIRY